MIRNFLITINFYPTLPLGQEVTVRTSEKPLEVRVKS